MQQEFWYERWQLNQIGFHSQQVNGHLQHNWAALGIAPGSRVFVPLCGKSKDMLWLFAQGVDVIGVELSPLAVQAFFAENGLSATTRQQGKFSVSETDGICIYCGDFFDLSANELSGVNAVYDRASLVALPPEMRASYAAHIKRLLDPGTVIFITVSKALPSALLNTDVAPKRFATARRLSSRSITMISAGE